MSVTTIPETEDKISADLFIIYSVKILPDMINCG